MIPYEILLIDDDEKAGIVVRETLLTHNISLQHALTGHDGLQSIKKNNFDLIICDQQLSDFEILTLLKEIKEIRNSAKIIIAAPFTDIKLTVQALKLGVMDYIQKPFNKCDLIATIKEHLSQPDIQPNKLRNKTIYNEEIEKQVLLVAPTDITVIITGETGIGKEVLAKEIHSKSKRSDHPFVAIDCGSLNPELTGSELFGHVKGAFTGALHDKKGLFEIANGGTLFLDEIGNLTYDNQIKLLRAIQEKSIRRLGDIEDKKVDVRIIVATHENLVLACQQGKFRLDLYHRLNEFTIHLLPLRARKIEIPAFAQYFLAEGCRRFDKDIMVISEEAMQKLLNYRWPGNLRELKNIMTRCALECFSKELTIEILPAEIKNYHQEKDTATEMLCKNTYNLKSHAELAEKLIIEDALIKHNFNISKTAKSLMINRRTLYNKIKNYHILLK